VFAVVPPQAITLSLTHDSGSSARNIWEGVVGDIDRLGGRARVGVTGSLPVVAEVTTAALDALQLRAGDTVHVAVKATEITIYPA
jgi:molybdate transport system ATP-binding protein